MNTVSVIIPAYNRRTVLARALRSVLDQKPDPDEVLVVDDGSTDGTSEWLAREFPSVLLIRQANQGPAAARNRGIEKAKGTWVAFLDSDDEWLPGKLKSQWDFFRGHPEYRIAQTEELWIRNGQRVNPMKKHQKYGGWIFEKCLPLCLISPSAVMMQKSLLVETGLFDESYPACEDYELWLRITAACPVGLITRPGIKKYGGHADQRSREFPAMDRFRIRALIKTLESGLLNPLQTQSALAMLAEKSAIFFAGAEKRGPHEEAGSLKRKLDEIKNRFPEFAL